MVSWSPIEVAAFSTLKVQVWCFESQSSQSVYWAHLCSIAPRFSFDFLVREALGHQSPKLYLRGVSQTLQGSCFAIDQIAGANFQDAPRLLAPRLEDRPGSLFHPRHPHCLLVRTSLQLQPPRQLPVL